MAALKLLSCLLILKFVHATNVFQGDKVYTITPLNMEDLKSLEALQKEIGNKNNIDFWRSPSGVGKEVHVHVAKNMVESFKKFLRKTGLTASILIDDIDRLISVEKENNAIFQTTLHKHYMDFTEIMTFLDTTSKSCGARCSLKTIGKSNENRNLNVIQIGNNPRNPIVWIDGGIHAREWISPATVVYIIDKLVNDYNRDPSIKKLSDSFNFHILPVHNPDGYAYTHSSTSARLWRKTRVRNGNCFGVDLNRNYGYYFGGAGTSSDPCSDLYRGTRAFSEKESSAVRDYITPISTQTRVFLTIHSYGQYILIPYGYAKGIYPPNYQLMLAAAKEAAKKIATFNGRTYTSGQSADVLYPAAGGSDDWARSLGIPFAYCFELPDTGRYGFNLPPTFIESVGKETLAGIGALLESIRN